MTAAIFHADGRVSTPRPRNGATFSLEELQSIVGGYIQIIDVDPDRVLVMNEAGKLQGLPPNPAATKLARLAGIAPEDFVVGDVLVCPSRMVR